MQSVFAEKLGGDEHLAEFILSTLEGAILLSRVQHSGVPLRRAGDHLYSYIKEKKP